MKKRYIFLLLFIFFFLDFSFLSNLFIGRWRFPYFQVSFLVLLLIKRTFRENILILFVATYLLSIITGISWWLMFIIWLGVVGFIVFLKTVFLEKDVSLRQANLIFAIITTIYFGVVMIINKFFIINSYYFNYWFDWVFYFLLMMLFFNFNLRLVNFLDHHHQIKNHKQ